LQRWADSQAAIMAAAMPPSAAVPETAFIAFDKLEREVDRRGEWKVLGRGAFGRVCAAKYIGEPVAVKLIELDGSMSDADKALFFREAAHHYCMRHPHIVQLLGVVADESDTPPLYALVMPRMPQSLQGFLYPRLSGTLVERVVLFLQISKALRYLHGHSIVHGDLKPANVLLTERGEAALADFGESTLRREGSATLSTHRGMRGTPLYMAPELASGSGSLKPASDIYSAGILGWELATGSVPFLSDGLAATPEALFAHVKAGGRPPVAKLPAELPAAFADLLQVMWLLDQAARPTAGTVVERLEAVVAVLRDAPVARATEGSPAAGPAGSCSGAALGIAVAGAGAGVGGSPAPAASPAGAVAARERPPATAAAVGAAAPASASLSAAAVEGADAAIAAAVGSSRGDDAIAALRGFLYGASPATAAAVGKLDLRNKNLTAAHVEALAGLLSRLASLRQLHLSSNGIGDAGAAALAAALPHLTQLQQLDLDDNRIGAAGAAALAAALPRLTQLQQLHLSSNGIGGAGVAALAAALSHLPQLQQLNLSDNRIV
jgi:serine/threonine-protein kinase